MQNKGAELQLCYIYIYRESLMQGGSSVEQKTLWSFPERHRDGLLGLRERP